MPSPSSGRTAAERRKLLVIVEDDEALSAALAFALEVEGYATRAYPDAESFLAEATTADPDAFILDYRLPGLNGLALLDRIRQRSVTAPAIVITTPTPAVIAKAAAASATIVEKPLHAGDLMDVVRRLAGPPAD